MRTSSRSRGTWAAEAGEGEGKPLAKDALKEWKIVIKGDDINLRGVKFIGYSLDPSKTPKAVDIWTIDLPLQGIYKVEEDKLHLCLGTVKERPKRFASDAKRNHIYLILKREKS